MVLQGGYDGVASARQASRYDPVGDTWYPAANFGSPREGHTMVWTGKRRAAWGGSHNGKLLPGLGIPLRSGDRRVLQASPSAGCLPGPITPRSGRVNAWSFGAALLSTSTGSAYCSVPSCPVVSWFRDADGDAFGNGTDAVLSCVQPLGYVTAAGDCNDASAAANPSATEACDGLDNDCDAVVNDVARPGAVAGIAAVQPESVTISWDAVPGRASL